MTDLEIAPTSIEPASRAPGVPIERPEVEATGRTRAEARQPATKVEALAVIAQGLTIFGLIVGLFLVYLVGISALEHGRSQRSLRTAFHRDLDFGNAWIGGQIPEGAPVAELAIARIGVHEIVVEGTSGAQLRNGPGHLRTAPLPGQAGNVVIAGRRVAYGAPFRHLDELAPGDSIVATTGQGRATYRIDRVREIDRDAPDAVDEFGDNRLTLITSAPELRASRRLVVTAALRSAPHAVPAARPSDIGPAELGLHSDGSTADGLLLWAQALLAASLATAWLRRRWRRWPTYLVAVPVLALLVLMVFDNFGPVLPSTL